ncbi:MAG: NAD-dependent epimerase/dehydratase family protein [Actinomycetota bacterium]|nr:NAD-dependent epimerase/dehydratase family protein [Actinomycetota bacterium]
MILVTGASGFIGSHLVGVLAAEGHDVRALVRSEAGAEKVRAAVVGAGGGAGQVEVVMGDVTDAASLHRAARGAELVYHLAGTYRGSPDELHATHVGGTKNLLGALAPGARLVLVSSTSVYGWDQSWPADHATPPRPSSAYGVAKLTAEQMVLGWTEGEGVVARTTIVYGPGDTGGMLPRAVRLLQRGLRWFPGDGANRIHLLHVDDLAAGLSRLSGKGGGVFLFGGPEAAPLERILTLLAEGAGLPRPAFVVPSAALRPVAASVEALWGLTGRGGEPPLTRHSVDVACRDRAYSWDRAADELGWSPQITLEVGVPDTGRWLVRRQSPESGPVRTPPATNGAAVSSSPEMPLPSHGFEWRSYFADADEGLGTVYERFALQKVLESAMAQTGSTSVLHAPLFGMLGVPGLDAVFLARSGTRVGLLDFDEERFDAVRSLWSGYGLTPEIHQMDSADPATWPEQLPASYDLVFSFAALWWFEDPWAVVAAQARWARKGVLVCVPNRNVFMKLRSLVWHRDQFEKDLNVDALDTEAMTAAAKRVGLRPVDTGLFDIPPFPDTSVPLAKGIRRILAARQGASGKENASHDTGPAAANNAAAWRWSILPYLEGDDPGLADRVERFTILERHLPAAVAPHLAHHRYVLFVPDSPAGTGSDAATPAMAEFTSP